MPLEVHGVAILQSYLCYLVGLILCSCAFKSDHTVQVLVCF